MSRKRNTRAGVTLIEMLVVVTIIVLFAAVAVPAFFKILEEQKPKAAKTQIAELLSALGHYDLSVGTFPTTEQGLQALRVNPGVVANWKGPYLSKDIPLDPWGHPYVYKYPGEHGEEPDIISYGRDGQPGGEGENADVVSWK
jgi:general secretion pathway protein G